MNQTELEKHNKDLIQILLAIKPMTTDEVMEYVNKVNKLYGSLIEAREKDAVEGFARWWNVHGGKGEEFITRNSWREYKEHLTQTKGDKSMVKDETAIHSEEDVRLDKFWSNPHQQKERGNTGDTDVIFKTFKQHLIEVIEKNGWDWKASGGEKILEYLKHNKEGDKE